MVPTSVTILPSQNCLFCSHPLCEREDPLILMTPFTQVVHERCFLQVIPKGGETPRVLFESRGGLGARMVLLQNTYALKNILYTGAIAICVVAFGLVASKAYSVIITVVSVASIYLIARKIDEESYARRAYVVLFN